MTLYEKGSLFLLRVGLGLLFFYAGITKVLDSEWSAAGYLNNAKTFPAFYSWLASPGILPITNFINEWGLTLLGVSLLLGIFVRVSSIGGATLMLLYYFPAVEMKTFEFFPQIMVPYIGTHSVLVDEHIVYALALVVLAVFRAGRTWGLEPFISHKPSFFG
ncbi:MAG: DoxX family membrane protein [Candidatus Wildermuthbacteria bacterium]|nr:DoxX family membrane protein [Candidatus Wildermuthbacteria bacterium]